ncbi:MAG: nucleotidyltransferase family protein [Acidimicrobiales bacterium]
MRQLVDGSPPRAVAPSLGELRQRRGEVLPVFSRYGASEVRVFGSVARGEEGEVSDVDFLVRMEDGRSLFDLAGLVAELEDLLGCPVNVVSEAGLTEGGRFAGRIRPELIGL